MTQTRVSVVRKPDGGWERGWYVALDGHYMRGPFKSRETVIALREVFQDFYSMVGREKFTIEWEP